MQQWPIKNSNDNPKITIAYKSHKDINIKTRTMRNKTLKQEL